MHQYALMILFAVLVSVALVYMKADGGATVNYWRSVMTDPVPHDCGNDWLGPEHMSPEMAAVNAAVCAALA